MKIEKITSVEQVKAALKERSVCMGQVNPDAYHAWKKQLPNAISKSGLVDFMRNPYAYHWEQVNNVKKNSPAIRTGKLIDCITLTPELFQSQYVVEDVNRRTNAGKARVKEVAASGKELISKREAHFARVAANITMKHVNELPGKKYTQVAVWARIENIGVIKLHTPLTLCGMFDLLTVEENGDCRIVDLKTTSEDINDESALTRNIVKYNYLTQAAMYSDLFRLASGKELAGFTLLYLGIKEPEKKQDEDDNSEEIIPPYQTRQVVFYESDIMKYRNEYLYNLDLYAKAIATDNWGSSKLPDFYFSLPAWAEKKLD